MGRQKNNSETITENIFRNFYGVNEFIEKSAIPNEYGFVSKKGTGYNGYPDFFKDLQDFCIVVEAKANDHIAACAEVKHYMQLNNINKDIFGIAVSGQDEASLNVTYYLKENNVDNIVEADYDDELLSIRNLIKIYKQTKKEEITTVESLTRTLNQINKEFQDENIVRDTERSLFFSGIMIALKDPTFRNTYKCIQAPSDEEAEKSTTKLLEAHILNETIIEAIDRQLKDKISNLSKEYHWKDKFSFIRTIDYSLYKYKELIKKIEKRIFIPFENDEKQDILGKAYLILLKKAGKVDNKNIIITPDHIKSLMVRLARLNVEDVVLDTCTGTGGFLMEAMETMLKQAKGNSRKEKNIRENQLIGFEIDPVLFALACSNMFLHGDGRTNLIYRSSLISDTHDNIVNDNPQDLLKEIQAKGIKKCIINPPYENNKPIAFVKQAIDYLEPNGKLIVIMPTPTLQKNINGITEKILKKAKLDFVIKMPEKLFTEQKRTVNTSIFGFTKTPQQRNDKVLFYNLEDDGFVSIQHKGRIDKNATWQKLEENIYNTVINYEEIDGISEKRKIYDEDKLNCYGVRKKRNSKYEMVKISDLFDVKKGSLASEKNNDDGEYDFITASSEWKKHDSYQHDCEAIVMAVAASGSLGKTHYVNGKFTAANLCCILTQKKDSKYKLNLKFYNYYFNLIKKQLRNDLADGTSKLTINLEALKSYYIEYIPISEQNKFYDYNIEKYELFQKQVTDAWHELEKSMKELIG